MAISKIQANSIAAGAIPEGVTKSATAPSSPADGDLWYDTANKTFNVYNSETSSWGDIRTSFPANMSGGTEVTESGYKYHIFKSSGTLSVTAGVDSAEALIVAGGGGGGLGFAGGGGAGGLINTTVSLSNGTDYTITVGAGGVAQQTDGSRGNSGQDSTAFGLTAVGGGGGAAYNNRYGRDGGSGGGDAGHSGGDAGVGTAGQGNRGGFGATYAAGGGGGAGSVGGNGSGNGAGGIGGDGLAVSWISTTLATAQSIGEVSGASVYFAGGAGGSNGQNASGDVPGGLGGGGISTGDGDDRTLGTNGTPGTVNTGGGGGCEGAGGSGIVIIRYPI